MDERQVLYFGKGFTARFDDGCNIVADEMSFTGKWNGGNYISPQDREKLNGRVPNDILMKDSYDQQGGYIVARGKGSNTKIAVLFGPVLTRDPKFDKKTVEDTVAGFLSEEPKDGKSDNLRELQAASKGLNI